MIFFLNLLLTENERIFQNKIVFGNLAFSFALPGSTVKMMNFPREGSASL